MGKTHSKSRNYWMKRDAIIPVSKMTLMNGELARKCIQIESHEYFQKLFLFINRK